MSEEIYGKERVHHGPGKGSKRRPTNETTYRDNFDSINWSKPIDCPHCPNQGWFVDSDPHTGEPVQVQCEFCYTNPNSVFNRQNK